MAEGAGSIPAQPRKHIFVLLIGFISALVMASCSPAGLGFSFTGWAGPAVSGSTVYVGSKRDSDKASIRALNPQTGAEINRFTGREQPDAFYGDLVLQAGLLYATSIYESNGERFGRLWAINPGDLSVRAWEFPPQGQDAMGPLYGGIGYSSDTGTVYVGSADGRVYAVDASTGSPRRSSAGIFFDADSPIWGAPTVSDGGVYFATMGGTVFGIKEGGGKVLEFQADGAIAATPLVKDGIVYVGSFDKKFYAIGQDGTPRWTFPAGNWFWGEAILADDPRTGRRIFVGNLDGKVYSLDATSGREIWSFRTGQGVRAKPVLVNKRDLASGFTPSLNDQVLVVGSRDGRVYGLDPVTGRQVWQPFDAEGRVLGSISAGGKVAYVVNMEHKVFALDVSSGTLLSSWEPSEQE